MIEIIPKNKKGLILIVCAFLVLLLLVCLLFFSDENKVSIDKNDYKTISSVMGCEFSVNRTSSDTATAVMEISKDIPFTDYESYTFKNGEDLYLLFNMNNYIVAVKKGTSFSLSSADVSESLKKHSLQGIWFTPIDNVKKKGNTYTVDVTAQVVITNTLYNDFTGKLVTIEENGEEWSMFAGYISEEYIPMVEYVVTTLTLTEDENLSTEKFEVDMDEGIIIVEEESTEPASEEEAASESEESEASLSADNIVQTEKEEENKAYSSNMYSMLKQGSVGYMDILNEDTGNMEGAYIRINEVYNQEMTQELLADYEERTGDSGYRLLEIPQNCHLEAVSYDVRYTSDTHSYIDIKLVGVDGDIFRYRGMPYSSKTYDLSGEKIKENDWVTGGVVMYVVPDGCMEYAFNCSGVVNNKDVRAAWFYISTRE